MPCRTTFVWLPLLLAAAACSSAAAPSEPSQGTTPDGGSPADGGQTAADAGGGASCNSGGAGGQTCTPGQTTPYVSCIDLTAPVVSFAQQVMPAFQQSCASQGNACHGSPKAAQNESSTGQVLLGHAESGAAVDAATLLAGLVGVKSPENPGMDIVKAGDPANSYLMHKLDDDQCQYATACAGTSNELFANCGVGMPYGAGILDAATRDAIRRWIAQGAQNN